MSEPVKLDSIEMDTSIQCRSVIDTATVTEYAERMAEGDAFPPVVLFGRGGKSWIGDGWHRIMAARQIGAVDIEADVKPGNRKDALRYALGANAVNGLRRSTLDKRRCVEIALVEFGNMSSRAIAEMCGVDHKTVESARHTDVGKIPTSTRTDTLGRQQPAHKQTSLEQVKQAAVEAEERRYTEQVTDPLSGRHDMPDIDAEQDKKSEPPNLVGLKRYWKQANKKERNAFLDWLKKEGSK